MMQVFSLIYRLLSSMRLSVYLLAFSLVLVFFGTLDQVHFGIYETQQRYFQSVIAFWHYPAEWPGGNVLGFLVLPMPGGYALGPLFLLNLLFAHFKHFRLSLKTLGIMMIHGGLVLLLIGQMLTDVLQRDYQMWIDEDGQSNYAESFRHNELVIIETTDEDVDRVVSVSEKHLKTGRVFEPETLPFRIRIQRFMSNASIMRLQEDQNKAWVQTSKGIASRMKLGVFEAPPTYKQDERNTTTAIVELYQEDAVIGNWLLSNVFTGQLPAQLLEVDGRFFEIAIRFERKYFPFTVHLHDFTHDRYPGTDIPMNFSSKVMIENRESGEERDALIYMNHPLRYGGFTFYQASFAKDDTASMLQVVRNPGWFIPYLSCLLVSAGLLYQFATSLFKFAGRLQK